MENYWFRFCGATEVAQMVALESATFAQLDRPELLRYNGEAVFKQCVVLPHATLGAFVAQELVAFAILYVPSDEAENLSMLLDLDSLSVSFGITKVFSADVVTANYKLCIVSPHHRGNGLQYRLGLLLEAEAGRQGIELLCSTVSPLNYASQRSLERLGYRKNCRLIKYGLDRFLYYKWVD